MSAALAAAAIASASPGGGSAGDPFFPGAGNSGYGVDHYTANLRFDPRRNMLRGRVLVNAVASEQLSSFHLDFRGPAISSVRVGGRVARFHRAGGELIVTPGKAIEKGAPLNVDVTYGGRPGIVRDPDGSEEGWVTTDDGAMVLGEPLGTTAWLPCNNTPQDKASFTVRLTVPRPLNAISNGRLGTVKASGRSRTFTWRESQPMATYLATINIGRGKLGHFKAAGIAAWTLVDPREARATNRLVAKLGSILRFESKTFGPYPFDATGVIVDHNAGVGYALETQTRPSFDGTPDLTTLVHEQAHQWFGDSVTLRTWPQIWLHEGFATWAEWYYAERNGGPSAAKTFRRYYSVPASEKGVWNPPPGDPGKASNVFANSVYIRGAMTLEALRETIGTKDFLKVLRTWTSTHRHGNATITQFRSLAERVSGKDLADLFNRWLLQRGKPPGGPLAESAPGPVVLEEPGVNAARR